MQIVRVVKHGNSQAITVPRAYLRQLKWRLQDYVVLQIHGEELRARSLAPHITGMRFKRDHEGEETKLEA